MGYSKYVGGAVLVTAAAGLLGGCRIERELAASCTTAPPIPHHSDGVVFLSVDIPPKVEAGADFRIRVDEMGADAGPPGGETHHQGTLAVEGAVSPSGTFVVGEGPFGGPAFPVDLELTATGEPGETITVTAVSGSGVIGQLPNASLATCTPGEDALIATIVIAG